MAKEPITTDAERVRIDSGESRDKVAFPDPAAAPLGTDAEAAGYPLTAAERSAEQSALHLAPAARRSVRWPLVLWASILLLVIAMAAIAALSR